jgi:hypothetical protein
MAPFGDAVLDGTRAFLQAAESPLVTQVIAGYARGWGVRKRIKLYAQFDPRAGERALRLARALTGCARATDSDALPLHLLGLDLGERGLVGYKLYFVAPPLGPDEVARRLGGPPRALAEHLRIHRGEGPDDEGAEGPCALDFACEGGWSAIGGAEMEPRFGDGLLALRRIHDGFRVRLRRASLSLAGAPPALHIYYVLDESDLDRPA